MEQKKLPLGEQVAVICHYFCRSGKKLASQLSSRVVVIDPKTDSG